MIQLRRSFPIPLIVVVVHVIACFSGLPSQADFENLLVNPDFEQAGTRAPTPEFWYVYSPDGTVLAATRGETLTDARLAHEGSHCARVTSPGIRMHHGRDISVEQGKEYLLSFFVRGKGTVRLGWYELKDAAFLKTIEETETHDLTDKWQQFVWRSAPQLKETNRVRVFLFCQGEVYVDTALFCSSAAFDSDQSKQSADLGPPLLAPTYVTRAPTIDGRMTKDEWDDVTMTTGFLRLDGKLSSQQTQLWAAFDEKRLYLCFRSFSPNGVVGPPRNRDDFALFGDDVVEVFLCPEGKGKYYQFAVNPAGTRYDAEGQNSAWNADWQAACDIAKDPWLVKATWTVELAIPFEAFGLSGAPADGTVWTANFTRDWTSSPEGGKADNVGRWTTWASVGGNFHNPARFGRLLFSRRSPALQITDLGDLPHGRIALRGTASARLPQEATIGWTVTPQREPDKRVVGGESHILASPKGTPLRLDGAVEVAGTSAWPVLLTVSAKSGNDTFFRMTLPYEVVPGFRVDIASVYTKKFLEARFDIERLASVPADARGLIRLVTKSGEVMAQAELPHLGASKKGRVQLFFKDAAPGEYLLETSVVNAKKETVAARTQAYVIPPPPVWLGNTLGISDKVPLPFEGVKVSGTNVAVWGRTYQFRNSMFPTQILNQGVPQLARPMELAVQEKGKKHSWTRVNIRVVKTRPTEATLSYWADCAAASVQGTVTIEYDGWAMFDFTLTPKGARVFDGLRLEVPFPRKEAAFLRASGPIAKWPEDKSYVALIGDVPNDTRFGPEDYAPDWKPEGWQGVKDFIYQLFVGNDHRGLFVLQDREENRFLKDGNVEVYREGDITCVRVHLINQPTRVDRPLHYTLGIVATPFKKYRHDLERLSFAGGHNPQWVIDNGLKGMIPGSLVWKWGRIEKDYTSESPEYLRGQAAAFKAAGMQCLPNQSNSFCVTPYDPFDTFKDEWVYDPYISYPNHEGTRVSLIMCSPQGSFADFYLWWVKQMIDEYGIGGLYFDLSGWAGNSNPLSGGGWTDAQGGRRMTSTIFALRKLYKRIYTLLKEEAAKRGQEFYVFQHSAPGPITAFTDQVTWGEGYSEAKDWNCVTPNLFRANSLRSLGAAFTFYPTVSVPWYREGRYLAPHHQALARSLINGTLTCSLFTEQVTQDLFPLWKWWKEFDVDTATWVPWFDKDQKVKADPSSLYVSYFQQPGKTMLVVSNLSKEQVTGALDLDLRGLGLPTSPLRAAEVHGSEIWDKEGRFLALKRPEPSLLEVKDGKLVVTIGPENYCVIRLPAE